MPRPRPTGSWSTARTRRTSRRPWPRTGRGQRIHGIRSNASTSTHAELDEATELDAGDPAELAAAHDRLTSRLPNLAIVGGCCGTDSRHVAALWGVAPR